MTVFLPFSSERRKVNKKCRRKSLLGKCDETFNVTKLCSGTFNL